MEGMGRRAWGRGVNGGHGEKSMGEGCKWRAWGGMYFVQGILLPAVVHLRVGIFVMHFAGKG